MKLKCLKFQNSFWNALIKKSDQILKNSYNENKGTLDLNWTFVKWSFSYQVSISFDMKDHEIPDVSLFNTKLSFVRMLEILFCDRCDVWTLNRENCKPRQNILCQKPSQSVGTKSNIQRLKSINNEWFKLWGEKGKCRL